MKNFAKRSLAMLLALVMCLGLLPSLSVYADTVDYVYSGSYIYNWGQRGTTATFLSQNAEAFYEDNGTSYAELAALSGASSTSDVPSSALYLALKSLMTNAQTYQTSYAATKDLFQYTDCMNSGGQISSFYSGTLIGPSWDGTWNREHTWPNSKGDDSGNGENDIMMLRPTATSENSSRGNAAYGESSGFYHPNSESDGTYDLRGDVCRIMLFVYTRWGNTGSMWGSSGVIESKELLLEWMEADPVDTWELGRNDAVESITGTRNVFVDYPELAFLLFDEDVPANYDTPSGEGAASAYTITATSNNTSYGTVSVSGNKINATPKDGYYTAGYSVVSGSATVTQSGNAFTVTASSDCTIQIIFKAKTVLTVNFSENGTVSTQSVYAGDAFTLPSASVTVDEGYTFIGWTTAAVSDSADKPASVYTAGSSYTATASHTLYALYTYRQTDGSSTGNVYELYTGSLEEGDYILTYETDANLGAMTAEVTSGNRLNYTEITLTNGAVENPSESIVWHIAPTSGGYTIYNESTASYAAGTSTNNQATLLSSATTYATWTVTVSSGTYDFQNSGNSRYLRRNSNYGFACYSSSTGGALTLYKGTSGTVYYTTSAVACTHEDDWDTVAAVAPGCTTIGYTAGKFCNECMTYFEGHEVIEATGHTWSDEWVVITAATCEADGEEACECLNCSELKTQTVAATGHSYTGVVTAPTVSEQGYTTYTCASCGDSYISDYVEALGETYTVSFSVPGGVDAVADMLCGKDGITLPAAGVPEETYTFVGWTDAPVADETAKPTVYAANAAYTATANTTLYALYSYVVVDGEDSGSGDYVKVTEEPDDWSGEYLIVYETDGYVFNGSLTTLDVTSNYQAVTITDNTISADEGDPYRFIIEAVDGGYSIKSVSGYYIGRTANSNGLDANQSTVYANTISFDSDGTLNVIGSGGAYLRFNSSSGQTRFRYFKSSTYTNQKAIALYIKAGAAKTTYYTTCVGIESASVTLESVPGVNFHAPEGYVLSVTVGAAEAVEAVYADGAYSISIPAQDMMNTVTATLCTASGTVLDTQVFTLADYVAAIIADETQSDAAKELANALLAYCQYAATAAGNYSGTCAELSAIAEDAFEEHTFDTMGAPAGSSIYGYIDYGCALRIRLPEGYTATVDGIEGTSTAEILAQDYDEAHTFVIFDADGNEVYSRSFTVLAYIGQCLTLEGLAEDIANLLTALYHYHTAAEAYIAE